MLFRRSGLCRLALQRHQRLHTMHHDHDQCRPPRSGFQVPTGIFQRHFDVNRRRRGCWNRPLQSGHQRRLGGMFACHDRLGRGRGQDSRLYSKSLQLLDTERLVVPRQMPTAIRTVLDVETNLPLQLCQIGHHNVHYCTAIFAQRKKLFRISRSSTIAIISQIERISKPELCLTRNRPVMSGLS